MRQGQFHFRISVFAAVMAVVMLLVVRAAQVSAADVAGQSGLLGVGDWVSIQIAGQPDATSYISADGNISVPLVGAIPVAGISAPQAATLVATALKNGGFFVDPRVTIRVTSPQTQTVAVVGEVQTQGRYPITPRTTIVDLVAQAGGLKESAADVGFLQRTDESGHLTRVPVNLNLLTGSEGAPTSLLGGDQLVVPRAEHFSIEGEVTTPGRYRIEPGMTVTQAIARAGGVTEKGSERRVQIKRSDKPGHYKTTHANLGELVQPGDIIRVKESLF